MAPFPGPVAGPHARVGSSGAGTAVSTDVVGTGSGVGSAEVREAEVGCVKLGGVEPVARVGDETCALRTGLAAVGEGWGVETTLAAGVCVAAATGRPRVTTEAVDGSDAARARSER